MISVYRAVSEVMVDDLGEYSQVERLALHPDLDAMPESCGAQPYKTFDFPVFYRTDVDELDDHPSWMLSCRSRDFVRRNKLRSLVPEHELRGGIKISAPLTTDQAIAVLVEMEEWLRSEELDPA